MNETRTDRNAEIQALAEAWANPATTPAEADKLMAQIQAWRQADA